MVVSCGTETGDGSKGSGALYVSGFDGSFPYILAGEFVCTLSKLLSIEKLPLLLLLCCRWRGRPERERAGRAERQGKPRGGRTTLACWKLRGVRGGGRELSF